MYHQWYTLDAQIEKGFDPMKHIRKVSKVAPAQGFNDIPVSVLLDFLGGFIDALQVLFTQKAALENQG